MFKVLVLTALVASAVAFHPRLDGRIVGGDDARVEDYPHQISLQTYGNHICGGSIIGDKWIVTAAHCTDGVSATALNILAGVTQLSEVGQKIYVARVHQHPKFSMSNIDYDVSVLELDEPIVFDESARPIALPAEGSDPAAGTDVVCTGWGALREGGWGPDALQAVSVKIVGRDACNRQYGSITERMICAGVPQGGKDACQGDSGGPLVADGQLVGVVSWGYGCARPDYSGVYSNVGNLRGFIKETSGL